MNISSTVKHYALHAFGLTLSLSAIFYTFRQFSPDPVISTYFSVVGIFAGLAIQYLRGMAAAYRDRGGEADIKKAKWLWAAVITCIMLFDFVSSFGVMVSQINKTDQAYAAIVEQKNAIRDEIYTLTKDIKYKKGQQAIEFTDKGRGPRYNQYEVEIGQKETELKRLRGKLDRINSMSLKAQKTVFAVLGEKSGIPSFWIEFTLSLAAMFLIYFIPLLTPWKVTIGRDTETVTSNRDTVTKHIRASVTSNVTSAVTKLCDECGKPSKDKTCPACRKAAQRERERLKEAGAMG